MDVANVELYTANHAAIKSKNQKNLFPKNVIVNNFKHEFKKNFCTNFNLNVIIVDVSMSINILKPCYILNSVIKNLLLVFRNVEHLLFKIWLSFIFWNFVKAVYSFVKYAKKTLRWIFYWKIIKECREWQWDKQKNPNEDNHL